MRAPPSCWATWLWERDDRVGCSIKLNCGRLAGRITKAQTARFLHSKAHKIILGKRMKIFLQKRMTMYDSNTTVK